MEAERLMALCPLWPGVARACLRRSVSRIVCDCVNTERVARFALAMTVCLAIHVCGGCRCGRSVW